MKIKNQYLVEVGCGSGGILQYFSNIGANVLGVDYGVDFIEFGRNKGLKIINGSITTLREKGIVADLVILSHVVEHFNDPYNTLKDLQKVVKDDGLVYIEVPGLLKLHKDVIKKRPEEFKKDFLLNIGIEHPFIYTLNNLCNLLNIVNLELVEGNENVFAIFKKISKKNINKFTIINKKTYINNLKYIKWLEKEYQFFKKSKQQNND